VNGATDGPKITTIGCLHGDRSSSSQSRCDCRIESALALKEVTQTVPIVFVVGTDPVKIGLQT
jgi:hypothetical protein